MTGTEVIFCPLVGCGNFFFDWLSGDHKVVGVGKMERGVFLAARLALLSVVLEKTMAEQRVKNKSG